MSLNRYDDKQIAENGSHNYEHHNGRLQHQQKNVQPLATAGSCCRPTTVFDDTVRSGGHVQRSRPSRTVALEDYVIPRWITRSTGISLTGQTTVCSHAEYR